IQRGGTFAAYLEREGQTKN
ncbi:hypothetical protein EVA_16704, partial [gut metagenome]